MDNLCNKGAKFVEELDKVPHGAVVIFSAHGASVRAVEKDAEASGASTCSTHHLPAGVTKVQLGSAASTCLCLPASA
ncbi:MAG: hypothetical protein E5299_01642 [Burkholderia gladioli]|nr:MAG: hypothetical protein E5299_01642 [Burkholderia gladioli]